MNKTKLLDSFAILALLKKEDNYHFVLELLNKAKIGKNRLVMNQINAGEIYYIVKKRNLTADFNTFWNTFLMLPIAFIANDFNHVVESAKIKSQFPLSYADSFAVYTAVKEGASIVTGDPEFKSVEGIVKIEWI